MSLVVNPEAIVTEKQMPWLYGAEKLFENDTCKKGIGKGEIALVSHLLGIRTDENPAAISHLLTFLGGQSETHDVSITSERVETFRNQFIEDLKDWHVPSANFGQFEVKDGRFPTIRLGEEGMAEVSRNYEFFREVSREIRLAIEAMDEMLELTLSPATYQLLRSFAENDCPSINAGTLSSGRAIGSLAGKYAKQKFGLYQAVRIFSQLKRARLRQRAKGWKLRVYDNGSDVKTSLYLTMHQSNVVGTLKMNMKDEGPALMQQKVKQALTKHLGFNGLEADLMYHLDHRVFDDPELVIQHFRTLAAPSKAFAKVDFLALVTDKGVEIIPRDRLDERLTLTNITQGSRPCYSVNELAA